MASLSGFDANEVEPAGDFEPLPAGKYIAVITDTTLKPTKAGNGEYLEIKFQVLDEGPYKGRNLWTRLNLKNPNDQAVQIARSELSSICRAVGVMQPKDSADLHDRPLGLNVKLRARPDTGELTNEVKGFESLVAEPAAAPPPKPAVAKATITPIQQPTRLSDAKKAPWKK